MKWHCYFANSPHGHRQLPSRWVLLTVSHLDSGAPFFFEDPSDDVARVSHSKPEIILAFAPPSDVMFSLALILIFRAGSPAPSRCPSLRSRTRNPNPRRTSWACRGERGSGACLISINISLAFVCPPGLAVLIGRICRAGIPMAISFSTSHSLISRIVLAFHCAPKSK